jgi:hypothetical protein
VCFKGKRVRSHQRSGSDERGNSSPYLRLACLQASRHITTLQGLRQDFSSGNHNRKFPEESMAKTHAKSLGRATVQSLLSEVSFAVHQQSDYGATAAHLTVGGSNVRSQLLNLFWQGPSCLGKIANEMAFYVEVWTVFLPNSRT